MKQKVKGLRPPNLLHHINPETISKCSIDSNFAIVVIEELIIPFISKNTAHNALSVENTTNNPTTISNVPSINLDIENNLTSVRNSFFNLINVRLILERLIFKRVFA